MVAPRRRERHFLWIHEVRRRCLSIAAALGAAVGGVFGASAETAAILFVDADATGANDGSSWADAFARLQDAAGAADPGDEIWVAEGVYHPANPNGDRAASFVMKGDVSWFGGFEGNETDRAARDPAMHPTILSGDLNEDDGGGTGVDARWYHMGENSYHVVTADNLPTRAVIDGFTIKRGWSWSSSGGNSAGAGMRVSHCDHVSIVDCRFELNLAHSGAGLLTLASNATVDGCTFYDNLASDGRGGAIYHGGDWENTSSTYLMTIAGSTFNANTATVGGGPGDAGAIWCDFGAPVHVDGCLFQNNQARWRFTYGSFAASGGAMLIFGKGSRVSNTVFQDNLAHVGGALWIGAEAEITNCLFVSNEAIRQSVGFYDYGGFAGAVYAPGNGSRPVVLDHCTFHANTARNIGGVWGNPGVTIVNSILWTNTSTEVEATPLDHQLSGDPVIRYSCIKGLPNPENGTIVSNPVFVDENGADDFTGNGDDDLRLSDGSPCIDSGENAAFPAWAVAVDLAGNDRFLDDPLTIDTGAGASPLTDMGALEFVAGFVPPVPNIKPVASFTYSVVDNAVTFTDTSTDADGVIVQWIWDFGDGASSTLPNPAHSYLANGVYDVTLTVRDNANGTHRSPPQPVSVAGLTTHSVAITSPGNGNTVAGDVPIVTIHTNDTVRVKLYVDGIYTGIKVTAPDEENPPYPTSYTISWNTMDPNPLIGVPDGIHVISVKANDNDEREFWSQEVTVTVRNAPPPEPVEVWRAANFSATDLADPAKEITVWGGGADPDGDGLTNEGEFGLGANPNEGSDGDGAVIFGTVEEGGRVLFTMTYRRRNDDAGLQVDPMISEDLIAWASGPSVLQVLSSVDQANGYDVVTVKEIPGATLRKRCFGRVSVTRNVP